LDADKEGFLRSETSMVQTIGRAARHVNGQVVMYGDRITRSMGRAIEETERRRSIQESYNHANGITPQSIQKSVRAIIEATQVAEEAGEYRSTGNSLNDKRLLQEIDALRQAMMSAAERLEFEVAAEIRDELKMLEKELQTRST
jgi:excinuclease ABC subunit B